MERASAIVTFVLSGIILFSALGPVIQSAGAGRAPGQNLNVDNLYTVGGTETWDTVFVKSGGTLVVPFGTTLNARSILLQGGAFLVPGGTVLVTQTTLGADAVIMGDCTEFNVSGNGRLVLRAPNGDITMDESQGGDAIVLVNASSYVGVTGGASIRCTGGNGTSTDRPWTTAPLDGYVSAGGRGYISLGGPLTPKVDVSGGAELITAGMNAGHAADGKPGVTESGGQGGGFSNGGMVSEYVGSGGDGVVEISGMDAVLDGAIIRCTGGRGGDAGDGADGSDTGGGSAINYAGGGGGGGYAGGNGGSDYQNAGKSGTATGNVGAGGYANVMVNSHDFTLRGSEVVLKGGDGGTPGNGGKGGDYLSYPYYASGGGGGGFAGGGGASAYAAGGTGMTNGNVGAGGEANMSILCWGLVLDGLQLSATGGNSQKGGTGGDGRAGGAGGGGYGGGGGSGQATSGGNGGTTGNVGAGGNGTFVAVALNISVTESSFTLNGGTAGDGGNGGRGGNYGGGGGGGYGGGGGAGYYANSGGGTGNCAGNTGRGGMALARISCGNLWVNTSAFNATGGNGGDGGTGGASGGTGGGGGGGYGAGGGGSYYAGSDSTVSPQVGDGGDAQLEFYCSHGSISADWNQFNPEGGTRGDGKTSRGGGTAGGSGKGRPTSDGGLNRNIPRLVPYATGPANNSQWNNVVPTLSWLRQLDGVMFPGTSDSIQNYEVQIDNDSEFLTPDEDAKDVLPADSTYLPQHLRGGHYFWRVRALYEGAKSPGWSEVLQFELNGPPAMLKPIPAVSFAEDSALEHALDLNEYFTDDLYPDELSYSVAYEQDSTKVDAEVDESWVNLYSRTPDWYGVKKVAVRATDKGGISALSNNFTVTVTPANDPPFFLELPVVEVTEDESYTFDLSPYVSDVDTMVEQLKIYFSSPYATVEGLNITFLYPRAQGSDRLNISLSDGMATVYGELEVKIAAVDDVPVTMPIPPLVTSEDTNLSMDLTLFATDEEDLPSQLKWTAQEVPTDLFSVSIDEHNVMRITPVADKSGEGSMLLSVQDTHGNEASVGLTVKVQTVNDAPVIAGVPNQTLTVNVVTKLDVSAYVHDDDNDKSELRVTVYSLYASVSGFMISFEYPLEEGLESDMVRILVSDGKAMGHQDISVTLKFPPAFGEAVGEIDVEVGKEATVDLARYVYDREDGPTELKWAITRVDKALIEVSVDSGGEMKIRANKGRTGNNDIYLVVTDRDGNKVNQTLRVMVTPASSIFGSGEGTEWLMWALPLGLVVAMVGAAGGMYMIALRRKKRLEEEQGREERKMLPTGEERMVTARGPAKGGVHGGVPADKVCFACGSKLVTLGSGSYQCVKCGRTQK